jgi:ribosomal protein S18 acetylase RimI-like enzyme
MILSIPQTIDGNTTHLVVFIQDGDSLVGSVRICADARHQVIAKLYELFVERQCRLEGIGTQLMQAAEEIAAKAGAAAIGLHVNLMNLAVIPFYEKLGYKPVYQFDDGDVQLVKQLKPFTYDKPATVIPIG